MGRSDDDRAVRTRDATLAAPQVLKTTRESDGDRERALDVMTRAQYWYGVAFAQRVAARIWLDRGAWDGATAAFDDAARTFERIGARFEAQQTRDERDRVKAP